MKSILVNACLKLNIDEQNRNFYWQLKRSLKVGFIYQNGVGPEREN